MGVLADRSKCCVANLSTNMTNGNQGSHVGTKVQGRPCVGKQGSVVTLCEELGFRGNPVWGAGV